MEQTVTSQGFAEIISAALDEAGISLRKAAEETGIPLTTLHRRLLGTDSFKLDELTALARLLGTTMSDLTARVEAAA